MNSLNNLPQKARAVFESPAIISFAGVSAEKFVAQISVAMLSVDKIEPQFPSHSRRAVVVLDDAADLPVGEDGDGIVRRQSHPAGPESDDDKGCGARAG
jgi:hypothetical protein